MNTLRLHTERLLLRILEMTDAPNMARLANDRRVAQGTLNLPHPYTEGDADDYIIQARRSMRREQSYNFAITLGSTNVLIGVVGLIPNYDHLSAEIGYWIGYEYWGKGYTTEAANAVLRFAFDSLRLNRVFCSHFVNNPASGRVMQKLGMTYEGTLRQHFRRFDQTHDVAYYGILRKEYLGR